MHQETVRSHWPSTHEFEQHSASPPHALPEVLQLRLRGVQVWSSAQLPPQHSPSESQACPSDTHVVSEHVPASQRRLQQSVGAEQPAPVSPQATIDDSQVSVTGLHV
jgi:hypothetical protein